MAPNGTNNNNDHQNKKHQKAENQIQARLSDGGGYAKVGEPLTVEEEYAAAWKRARLDTNELARLRSEGWTVSQLVAHFGYSRTSIKNNLRQSGKEVCSYN